MAIYSCNLASIGRSTHAAGTAGAHLRYVSREGAEPLVEAHGIPLDPTESRAWMDREEINSRSNARLVDKVRVAIPRELAEDDRAKLVRDFVSDVTQDRVPWLFAIHQRGDDANNPHAHIVLRDRDLHTGGRVLRLSDSARDRIKAGLEPKGVEWIRERWEHHANAALTRAGVDARIDRRTLAAQGIDREPTIHIGVRGAQVERHVQEPKSKKRRNALGREIDYPAIDGGRTRMERHAEIVDLNLERAARSPDFETRQWALFERAQGKLDRQLETELAGHARKRTKELRALKSGFRERTNALRGERQRVHKAGLVEQRESVRSRVVALRERHGEERRTLRKRQSTLWARLSRTLDFTGGTGRKQSAVRREQIARHKAERSTLARDSHLQRTAFETKIAQRFDPQAERLRNERSNALDTMRDMHERGEAAADAKRQLRERAREQERQRTAELIRAAKVQTRGTGANALSPGLTASVRDQLREAAAGMRSDSGATAWHNQAARPSSQSRHHDRSPGR